MIAFLTGHQLNVVSAFSKAKEQMLPTGSVKVIYRAEGYNVNVGLAFSEGDQCYIVRQTIRWYANNHTIFAAATRLIEELGKTYTRSTSGRENLFERI